MSGAPPKVDVAGLKASVDIVEVVGRHVALKKNGADFEACCPFHSENTASFKVSGVKQIYHCFGCGASGDAIDFLVAYLQIPWREACAQLGGSAVLTGEPVAPLPAKPRKTAAEWTPIIPVPDRAPPPPREHPFRGMPEAVYAYHTLDGRVAGYVYRMLKSDGKKEPCPLVWARNSAGWEQWKWMAFPVPRLLYRLPLLNSDVPVLVVEGEKCADRANATLTGVAALSWPGGCKAVAKADWSPLAGRDVVIWPDCDSERVKLTKAEEAAGVDPLSKPFLPYAEQGGVSAAHQIAAILTALEPPARVRVMRVAEPGVVKHGWDIDDAINEGWSAERIMGELAGADGVEPPSQPSPAKAGEGADNVVPPGGGSGPVGFGERRTIRLADGEKIRIIDESESALFAASAQPPVFQRDGALVRPVRLDRPTTGKRIKRSLGATAIRAVTPVWLAEQFQRAADYCRFDGRKKAWVPTDLPTKYAQHYVDRLEWAAPVLVSVVAAPLLRLDGSILHERGYDADTGIYLDSELEFSVPKGRISEAAVKEAAKFLRDLVGTFPFEHEHDLGAWVALAMTALMRPLLEFAPGFAIRAPSPASGKTKLGMIVSLIATGQVPAMMSYSREEEEMRKSILSILLDGDQIAFLDNVEGDVRSDVLCAVMTGEIYKQRALGENRNARAWTAVTWILTGNNLNVVGDLTERIIPIDIDAGVENPGERRFDRDIEAWVKGNRDRCVLALLILLRGFHEAGRPNPQNLVSRFAQWNEWIRCCVVWAGFGDPCLGFKDWERTDTVRQGLGQLLQAWRDCLGGHKYRAQDVLAAAGQEKYATLREAIEEVVADPRGRVTTRALGRYLTKYQGRIDGGLRLVCRGSLHRALQYSVLDEREAAEVEREGAF